MKWFMKHTPMNLNSNENEQKGWRRFDEWWDGREELLQYD